MTEDDLLAEAQALRELIGEYHRQDRWYSLATRKMDGPALNKFWAYFSQLFLEEQRQERLSAIGILVGRSLETTKEMTTGEVFAFLTWLKGGSGFKIRPGAAQLMEALRDQREMRVFMRSRLGKIKLRGMYATKPEDNATWVPSPSHKGRGQEGTPF